MPDGGPSEDRVTEEAPIACSLEAAALRQRLEQLAALGGEGLLAREQSGGRHRLRFRGGGETGALLAEIVRAEEACCPFLDLSLTEEGEVLLLTIAGSGEGGPVAAELAAAFGPPTAPD